MIIESSDFGILLILFSKIIELVVLTNYKQFYNPTATLVATMKFTILTEPPQPTAWRSPLQSFNCNRKYPSPFIAYS